MPEDDLEENVGSIGGREDCLGNARVRVTEPVSSQWGRTDGNRISR